MTDKSKSETPKAEELSAEDLDQVQGGLNYEKIEWTVRKDQGDTLRTAQKGTGWKVEEGEAGIGKDGKRIMGEAGSGSI